jgi:hypothetical protein
MTNTLTTAGPARAAQRRAPSPGGILAVVLTGQFMALLDASALTVNCMLGGWQTQAGST